MSQEKSLSFKASESIEVNKDGKIEFGESNKYSFVLESEKPLKLKKLGDGSYGSVFEVERGARSFAVKIFYEKKDRLITSRFDQEIRAGYDIQMAHRKKGSQNMISNLVLPIAGTSAFLESDAYKNPEIRDYFEKIGASVSNYALVMEKYECTLKDLLEKGRPAEGRSEPLRGYDIISKMEQSSRERFIAWVIEPLAVGLRALHRVGRHHHDIKPANILLRERGNQIELALSDFGFLDPNLQFKGDNSTIVNLTQEGLPLGTRHYRSSEQKDFFDICEVEVQAPASGLQCLITTDPKFRDTLMETGDKLLFSKDKDRRTYTIKEIKHALHRTEIIITAPDPPLNQDKRTQVLIYKSHTRRTDIFGIGGLIYDLLTIGNSPEGFYDYIRRWDKLLANSKRSENRINHFSQLYRQYEQVYYSRTPLPGVSAVFDSLRSDRGEYPSPQIVKILLRCMLSRTEEAYCYSADKGKSYHATPDEIFERIITDLDKLKIEINKDSKIPDDESAANKNTVWLGQQREIVQGTTTSFQNTLEKIRHNRNKKNRLIAGYWLFQRIADYLLLCAQYDLHFADEPKAGEANATPFFADMSPGSIKNFDGELRTEGVIFRKKQDYLDAISNNLLSVISNLLHSAYYPPYLSFMSRQVLLKGPERQSSPSIGKGDSGPLTSPSLEKEQPKEIEAAIRYTDSSPFWMGLEVDDFIVAGVDKPQRTVYEVQNRTGLLKVSSEHEGKALAVKRLRPLDYYLSIVGIYIHQIFFADDNLDFGAVPQVVHQIEQTLVLPNAQEGKTGVRISLTAQTIHGQLCKRLGKTYKQLEHENQLSVTNYEQDQKRLLKKGVEKPGRFDPIDYCYKWLAELYLWLIGRNFRRGNPDKTIAEYITLVSEQIKQLGEFIAEVGGYMNILAMNLDIQRNGLPPPGEDKEWGPHISDIIYSQFLTIK